MHRRHLEYLNQGKAAYMTPAARRLRRAKQPTVPMMVGRTIPLPTCSIRKISEGAAFKSFLADLNIDEKCSGRSGSDAVIRNGRDNGDGTHTAIILHHGDAMLQTPNITLTPSSTESHPTIDLRTWITLGCRTWFCADMHLTVRLRPRRIHFRSKNCVRCNYAMKQNKAWGKKMGLIGVEAGKEEEEPMMSDADDKEDRVG